MEKFRRRILPALNLLNILDLNIKLRSSFCMSDQHSKADIIKPTSLSTISTLYLSNVSTIFFLPPVSLFLGL